MMTPVASVYALRKSLDEKITRHALNDALELIQATVEQIIHEPLCTAQIFGSAFLDIYCREIGALTLPPGRPKAARRMQVYIVSKLQKSGGHTRVLQDFIRSAPADMQHVVLSTELAGLSDRAAIEDNLRGANVRFEWNEDTLPIDKLKWLQRRLSDLAPQDVWLFNHHEDSAAVAAAQPGQGYQIYFYHHGDHHLSLGAQMKDVVHVDPLPMGFQNCRSAHALADNVYLPLWVEDKGARGDLPFMAQDGLTTCTAASFNKVEVPYFISYPDMITDILDATKGRHIHIGRLMPWTIWKVRRSLKTRNIDRGRFIYIPWAASVWQALLDYRVDLYIASFPFGGARTLIEAMGAGIPVTVHDHYATRLLGGMDVSYPEAFVWRNPDDLYVFLKQANAAFLQQQSRAAREFFLKHHDAKLYAGFEPARLRDYIAPPPLRPHSPDLLQAALSTSRQVTMRGVVWRFLYRNRRLFKKLAGK